MSGCVFGTKCKACGKGAWACRDWKPVDLEVNECPHYECGFFYKNIDGVVETDYLTKEQIKELRIQMELELVVV